MRVEPLPRWARAFATLVVVAVLSVIAFAVWDFVRSGERVPTRLVSGEVVEPTRLSLVVSSCNKQPTTEVQESDHQVRVTAFSARGSRFGGDDCLDGATVRLDRPLGQRKVIDGSNGRSVPIQGQGPDAT